MTMPCLDHILPSLIGLAINKTRGLEPKPCQDLFQACLNMSIHITDMLQFYSVLTWPDLTWPDLSRTDLNWPILNWPDLTCSRMFQAIFQHFCQQLVEWLTDSATEWLSNKIAYKASVRGFGKTVSILNQSELFWALTKLSLACY